MLANLDDYEARYGTPADAGQVATLLVDAVSLVQRTARLTIELVADDTITVVADGTSILELPELPIVAVGSVEVDGDAYTADLYRVDAEHGELRLRGGCWPWDSDVEVVYSHGWDPVPDWIVGLACSMVQRAIRPATLQALQGETTGSQAVQYAGGVTLALGGASVWLTSDEQSRLEALKLPTW